MANPDKVHEWTDIQLEKLERKLTRHYRQASAEIKKKAKVFFKRYEQDRNMMLGYLASGVISQRDYDDWIQRKALTGQWYASMVGVLSQDALNADKKAMEIINGVTPRIYAENYNYGAYQIEKGLKINTSFALADQNTIGQLARSQASLLPKAALDIPKDLVWNQRHITSAVMQGILQGESVRDIANRLSAVVGMDRNSAIRNARTAVTGAENAGRIASYEQAESLGIKIKKRWMATLDDRTRDSHRELDGVSIENDEVFDNGCRYPGDPMGEPAEVYNCRCTLIADIDGVDMSDMTRHSRLGDVSYEEWKRGKNGKH